jgi:hypothetical protein
MALSITSLIPSSCRNSMDIKYMLLCISSQICQLPYEQYSEGGCEWHPCIADYSLVGSVAFLQFCDLLVELLDACFVLL